MICENCFNIHDGNYASGRFCKKECAKSFATKLNRSSINDLVSLKLSNSDGYQCLKCGLFFKQKNQLLAHKFWHSSSFKDLKTDRGRKNFIIRSQGRKCAICLNNTWQNLPIPIELDHIDGNSSNNNLNNLRLLCPNCHAQTETYRGKNIGKNPDKLRASKLRKYYKLYR
jgi:5-methylcytosine-specific restriction endonuclease McrA